MRTGRRSNLNMQRYICVFLLSNIYVNILEAFQPLYSQRNALNKYPSTPSRIKPLWSTIDDTTSYSKKATKWDRRRKKKRENRINAQKPHIKVKTYKDVKEFNKAKNAVNLKIHSHSKDTFTTEPKKRNDNDANEIKNQVQNAQHIKHRIQHIHDIKSSRTVEERQKSRDRLQKAKSLLDTVDEDEFQNVKIDMQETSVANSTVENNDSSKTHASKTVPDSYWYNGNLQQGKGSYVTRWQKGVKVAEPLKKYNPVEAEKLLLKKPSKWLVRNVQIGFPLALWAFGVVSDILQQKELENRNNRAKQLLNTISGLGPAIIKGGQALSSRSDLMPSEYLDQLQKLQDDVPRFANDVALQTVENELEIEFNQVFELVEKEPIAAASIGQVYKARLRSNGDLVALKIQRPNCEEIIALDLYVLRWWSGVANVLTNLFQRDINVQSIIDDFGELIYRELDYVAEAANAQRFNELYAGQVKDVFVPKIYSELTTSKVLTMEWVEGFRLTDIESLNKYGLDRKKLVDTLVQCSLRQILGNGFFHADPHGGNLLVVPDGRLCYLDFGMMSYAALEQRNGFLLAVVHIVNRDWDELVQMYQRLGFIPEGTDLKPIAVALENSLPDALNSDISELNFKNVVGKLGDIMYTYPFSLPPFYIAIIRCLGVLEGLAIQVDPQARIISEAYPYVASRVLTDPQDELQEALRRLALTNDGHIRWDRLESLLSKAKGSTDYDATVAINQLMTYLLSEDGESLLMDLVDEVVDGADALGVDFVTYLLEASRALAINDEVAAARAFTTLQEIISATVEGGEEAPAKVRSTLSGVLPEPTSSMQQFWRISLLLGARGSGSDLSKYIPLARKLSQEPKIQKAINEVIARLGERVLGRSLRALFGLSPTDQE